MIIDFITNYPWLTGLIIICIVFFAIQKGMNIDIFGMKLTKPDKADSMPIQNTNNGNNNGIIGNIVNINNNTVKQKETYMKHICQLCIDVLTHAKKTIGIKSQKRISKKFAAKTQMPSLRN